MTPEHPAPLEPPGQEAREDGRKSVLLLVDQGGELRFVAIRFAKKEG